MAMGGCWGAVTGYARRIGIAALLASVPLFATTVAQAQVLAALPDPSSIGNVDTTGTARPVQGWVKFCERYAGECDVNPAEPATIKLTTKTWRTLNEVNRRVNTTVKPKTDADHWGVVDRWDVPEDGYGDCEDYQLLKRRILVERYHLPRRALRMTVVIDEQGEGHAVLMVRTDEGDLILDNKRSSIRAWHQTGYIFVKREGQDSREWVSLGDQSSPVTTANR
jgi:predicted transglutaminase-like cysteine proteinase